MNVVQTPIFFVHVFPKGIISLLMTTSPEKNIKYKNIPPLIFLLPLSSLSTHKFWKTKNNKNAYFFLQPNYTHTFLFFIIICYWKACMMNNDNVLKKDAAAVFMYAFIYLVLGFFCKRFLVFLCIRLIKMERRTQQSQEMKEQALLFPSLRFLVVW